MAIKRKTINIKKVNLIKPSYTKPTPQKIVSFFTEPVHIPVEEIKVKKKRSNLPSQKVKKAKHAKHAKPVHKGPLILTKKSIQKLKPKEKQKKKNRSRKKLSKIARSNFPLGIKPVQTPIITKADNIELSDEYLDWSNTKQSAIDRLYNALHSMAEENPDSSSKELAHMGADYAVKYLKDTFIDYDEDTLAEYLLTYPVADFFDSYVLFYGGLGLVTGDTSQLYKLEDPLYRFADNLSYSYKKDLANSDRVDDI